MVDFVCENTSSSFIGNVDPFRYRGYYYDNETGFYYLQTRYYDPSICRFINADNYELIAQLASSKELNMYAYCGNNPIMYTDPNGEIAGWLVGLIIAGIILTVSDIYNVVENVDYTISGDGQSVSIKNSQTIVTPWVRWGYSFYLNHINSDTKKIIKGSSVGVEYEWLLHNVAYWLGVSRSQASPVDVGISIFSDNHSGLGDIMKISYIILQHPAFTIWDLIANKGYEGR